MQEPTKHSPPWYTLWDEINASIGNSQDVTVGELDTSSSPFTVTVTVASREKAVATASIMQLRYDLGEAEVVVNVKDSEGKIISPVAPQSPDQLVEMVKTALGENGWFIDAVAKPLSPGRPLVVFPVFSKAVIQFDNDNWDDLYQNYNNVVAFVFARVLSSAPGDISLFCSTAKG